MDWDYFTIPYNLSDLINGVKSIFTALGPFVSIILAIIIAFFFMRKIMSVFSH